VHYPGARPAPSPNYTLGRSSALTHVVLHTCESSSQEGCLATLSDPFALAPVSAHYVVGPDGEILSLVDDANTAWHSGPAGYNPNSIGIEIVGYSSDPDTWTPQLVASLGDLVGWLSSTYGIPLDYRATSSEPELARGFVAHAAIDPARRSDPGPWFPWDEVRARAAGAPPTAPGSTDLVVLAVLGIVAATLAWALR
jgi:N-acetyl-anhydromuramyl-L-alanine amidase AmpD